MKLVTRSERLLWWLKLERWTTWLIGRRMKRMTDGELFVFKGLLETCRRYSDWKKQA